MKVPKMVHGYLACAALALSACVRAQEPASLSVSDVRVETDLTAVSSRTAAAYWGNLSSDLSSAIAAEFVGQTAPDGWVVIVDIDEIALANLFQARAGADDARLTGDVALVDPASEEVDRVYTVSASANEAAPFLTGSQDIVTLSPTSAEFYAAVVRAFARGVADTLRAGAPAEI